MKNTLLLLILLPLLSFGQSKKDLKARIYSMQLDSASQAELISDQQRTIAEAQTEIQKLTIQVNELNGDLSEALDAWSLFKQQLKLTKDSVVMLQREVEPYLKVKEALENPDTVTYLDLSQSGLTTLPSEIGQLSNLQSLNLMNCELTHLPSEISKLQNLEVLILGGNDFQSLPPVIGQLSNLEFLQISGNQLTSLPPEIGQLTNLKSLILSGNQLTSLPPEIGQLANLKGLDLGGNELTTLPPEIGQLENLKGLSLGHNHITFLPPEIGQLEKLEKFYMEYNDKTVSLPPELGQLTNLKDLVMYGVSLENYDIVYLLADRLPHCNILLEVWKDYHP